MKGRTYRRAHRRPNNTLAPGTGASVLLTSFGDFLDKAKRDSMSWESSSVYVRGILVVLAVVFSRAVG